MKRGHVTQISISDENHHVTEAIGNMYGDHHYGNSGSRPLSFLPSPHEYGVESITQSSNDDSSQMPAVRAPLKRTTSSERTSPHTNGPGFGMAGRNNSLKHEGGPLSPSLSAGVRSSSDTANLSFPLNDIDYESNPAAVAQELSNLQALRRMSMDVNAAGDPDLPAFNSTFGVPTVAPSGDADEDDASRLFWVPARLHPELAPKEFKTFLDSRVDSIKRRSGDSSFSANGPERQGSGGGLRRQKSMLSRQIDNSGGRGADGYQDGAERLERKKSLSGKEMLNNGMSNLQELEVLVNDPTRIVERLSLDTEQEVSRGDTPTGQDMPILPAVPFSNSLRRSTRTTYRRGSLRKSDRTPFPKRGGKSEDLDAEDTPNLSSTIPASRSLDLTRDQSESHLSEKPTENFSRPGRVNKNRTITPGASQNSSLEDITSRLPPTESSERANLNSTLHHQPRHFVSQIASNGRSTIQQNLKPIPQIVETPPLSDEIRSTPSLTSKTPVSEKSSAHEALPSSSSQGLVTSNTRGGKQPGPTRQIPSEKGSQTLHEMAAHPSPLPGNSTRTDSLSFIPTLTEDKKADPKKLSIRKDGNDGVRKSSWSWGSLLGNEEKEKEKRKEEEARETKKLKSKTAKPVDRSHDNTRLDVLQTTMEGGRGRESLVIDRSDLKLEEERKKESTRKSSGGDSKKEKESSLFSSFFGGGKKKSDREPLGKKSSSRNLSPDPPQRILKPDVDYNWTRFSIIEERAIYRMAHIKLANPRRALYSQVLLSNFMYSYLAKVQQMHPQIQIPQTAAQKAQQRHQQQQQQQSQQKKIDQPDEFSQYQRYQEVWIEVQ